MRTNGSLVHIRAMSLVALALFATSCSRSLPTSPEAPVVRGGVDGADPFATVGLENQVVITLAPGTNLSELATAYGARVMSSETGEQMAALRPVLGQLPATLMAQLAADPRVVTAEPNTWLSPAEARQQSFAFDDGNGTPQTFAEQPAFKAIRLDSAPNVATGRGVKVAIIDTGLDLNHPALKHSIVAGWDFVDNDAIPADRMGYDTDGDRIWDEAYGHGTHVAGIVHALAPDALIMPVRVLDGDGRGDLVNVAAGVRWAVEHGARVINLSLGALKSTDALQNALEDAENAGVLVVASAGNQGSRNLDFPGYSSHVTSVAATDANAVGAGFSSYDGKVEISAPGVGVRSTFPGGGYRLWSGTSMSSPFIAGAAALLAEVHPMWTMIDFEARIQATARPIAGVPAGDPSSPPKARDYGAGMLDIAAALRPDFVAGPNQTPAPEDIRPR